MARLLSPEEPSPFRRVVEAAHRAGQEWIRAEIRAGNLDGWRTFWSSLLNEGVYVFGLYVDRQNPPQPPGWAPTPG